MGELLLGVLNTGLTASWVILAVIVLRQLSPKAPKWIHCFFWVLAAVRLILPVSIESPWSLVPGAAPAPETILRGRTFRIATGVPMVDRPVNAYLGGHYYEGVTVAAGNGSRMMEIAGWIWLAGMALLLLWALAGYLRLKKQVAASISLGENIYLCDVIPSPFILGIFRPRIYLPSGLKEEESRMVVAHEEAHLRRGDHLWKLLGFLLLAFYWFNPFIWAAYVLLCRDIELACDEKVIREMNVRERKDYAETLLDLSLPRHLAAACPLAFGEVGVKTRVKSVLNYRKSAFWVILLCLAACIVVAVCFLTNPMKESGSSVVERSTIPEEENVEDYFQEYEAFGVVEKNNILYYNGERIRFFLDGYESDNGNGGTSMVARFHQVDSEGTVDVHTVREDKVNPDGSTELFGPIVDIVPYSKAEFYARDVDAEKGSYEESEAQAVEEVVEETSAEDMAFASREAQWEADLKPYIPFGLSCSYDAASDVYRMYYEGKEVRGLYDEERGVWISESAGVGSYEEDAIDLYAVYENHVLSGLRQATAKEQEEWSGMREAVTQAYEEGESEGMTVAEILAPYQKYGLTYEKNSDGHGNLYYDGERLEAFWDKKPDGSIFSTQSWDGGSGTAHTVYDEAGKLTGIQVK